jgi:hypothetical protein
MQPAEPTRLLMVFHRLLQLEEVVEEVTEEQHKTAMMVVLAAAAQTRVVRLTLVLVETPQRDKGIKGEILVVVVAGRFLVVAVVVLVLLGQTDQHQIVEVARIVRIPQAMVEMACKTILQKYLFGTLAAAAAAGWGQIQFQEIVHLAHPI